MAPGVGADLLLLQGNIKKDPAGYRDEFELQWRHYKACLELFRLQPGQDGSEFVELVNFIAQVCPCYPEEAAALAADLSELLGSQHESLASAPRLALVKALILMRNRQQVSAQAILPLLFKLFRDPDKVLRALVFRHVCADVRGANRRGGADRYNRAVQNFLYSVLEDEHEGVAKKGLAVLTEMWRRRVWRDARTVNVIASAALHRSPRVSLAALKFFLGQDEEHGDEGGSDDEDRGKTKVTGPTKEDLYKAFNKGTASSKKRKQKKIKRVQASVARASRRAEGAGAAEGFAALQLLHDPQGFAEKLFSRLAGGGRRWEDRLAAAHVVSRAVGSHRLLLLNFYPWVQKYLAPGQRDVTQLMAILVQACHERVPPEALAPVLRTLVDQFVYDRARAEVATAGLKTIRELCVRAPLAMTPELLQDLASFRKFRDKEVAASARALVSLYRELAPSMLAKRERGRGANLDAAPAEYGAAQIADRIEGAELLEAALRDGRIDADGNLVSGDEALAGRSSDADSGDSDGDAGSEGEGEEEGGAGEGGSGSGSGSELELEELGSDWEGEEGAASSGEEEEEGGSGSEDDEQGGRPRKRAREAGAPQAPDPGSLASLRKQLAAAGAPPAEAAPAAEPGVPLEWGRILTQEDFESIRQLKHRRLVEQAMQKHGLKSASKREKALAAAEEEADEMLAEQERRGVAPELRVDPSTLVGRHKARKDKEERMASVLEGREGREFGAKSSLKKKKTGGLSNREKLKRKHLPIGARGGQVRKRQEQRRRKSLKNFKGHVRS